MNKQALARWAVAESKRNGSRLAFAEQLGVSHATVAKWQNKKCESLGIKSLNAIALYRGESVQEVASWLEIQLPSDGLIDFQERLLVLEKQVKQLLAA